MKKHIGVIIMIFAITGALLNGACGGNGEELSEAYSIDGNIVFPDLPIPTGDLTASSTVALPDIYNNGHGWTCTGLAYDAASDTFLVGDIGKATPSASGFASQLVRVSHDFSTVEGTIPLYTSFPSMSDVQGVTVDTSDGTIWFCSTEEKLIRHINADGTSIGLISLTDKPTGIAYSPLDDSLWILTYAASNNIRRISKSGTVQEQYTFSYGETLDQCFLDYGHGYLYITAGAKYQDRNNTYMFNTTTHEQSIACTVDSYSVEGIWIGTDRMVIVNDGYYHSALAPVNQANIYDLS